VLSACCLFINNVFFIFQFQGSMIQFNNFNSRRPFLTKMDFDTSSTCSVPATFHAPYKVRGILGILVYRESRCSESLVKYPLFLVYDQKVTGFKGSLVAERSLEPLPGCIQLLGTAKPIKTLPSIFEFLELFSATKIVPFLNRKHLLSKLDPGFMCQCLQPNPRDMGELSPLPWRLYCNRAATSTQGSLPRFSNQFRCQSHNMECQTFLTDIPCWFYLPL
jgi:hypothetical protein